MDFIGRTSERARLGRSLNADSQQAVLVFGRRRVGKSELIKRCLRDTEVRSIYYECKQTTEADNVQSIARVVSEVLALPPLGFAGIEELLDFLFQQATSERMILVLDEYPYLRSAVPGLDSILQSLLDRHRDTSKMTLVLCGSFADVMRELLERENPLYGRIDLTLELKPMDYYESSLFYPTFSDEDKVRLYSVFGGIPYYNQAINATLSARENILELIAAPGARFENEVSSYLSSEISKIANANEVFGALAQGYSKYKDILDQSHVSSGPTMVDILGKLTRMGLVEKHEPINDPGNRRKSGYRIVDGLSLFYYRYVFRYASQRAIMDPDYFYDRYIQDDFETQFVPHSFETICRQYLMRMNRAGRLPQTFDQIGRYWYDDPSTRSNGEFDVVTHDDRGYIFYEAKFRKTPITAQIIEEEVEQVRRTGLDCYRYGFFSRAGFEVAPRDDLILIGLNEMYQS